MDLTVSHEWTAEGGSRLEVPLEYQAMMRWRFALTVGRGVLRGRCGRFELLGPGWLRLEQVLLDTSVRHDGIVLQLRVTYQPALLVGCQGGTVVPIDPGDVEAPRGEA
ncbi:MAG: hypothetical protein AUI52_05515 [Acidobacteria bacterium 13_1_40CM_2_68_10]|nr:MAG: hypothetical protein AUI52_05515 [Acidobacteria bacterium 13_1_40CM_2_68_10]